MRPELEDTMAAGKAARALALDETAAPSLDGRGLPSAGRAAEAPRGVVDRTATAPRATAPTAAIGLASGQQLGHFRIEKPLGAGGMGEVYLATDLALERPVAIKVLPTGVAREPARRDRLVREARSQARITHPNVGHIYFIGEEAGHLYFAMEYVAGETVAARVAKGPLSVDDALAVIRSAALGLREAQRNGITHRDIKPSNLMIDGHDIVKVLDFGLAASAPSDAGGIDDTQPVAQTTMAGTPLYMAPEQARGEPVDFRSDIYALGATLFHLVAGRPPFEADTLDALLSKHSSAVRPSVPRRAGQPRTAIAAIDALCSRMMAPAPADRFASYDELLRALELASVEHMRPAGFWARSMAVLVDLIVTGILLLLVMVPIQYFLGDVSGDKAPYVLGLFAAYAIALTARNGRTLGQSLFELEVVDVETGQRPSLKRAIQRVVIPLALPFFSGLINTMWGQGKDQAWYIVVGSIVGWIVPPIGLLWAALRSVSRQTIWDRRSGTVVRYRTRRPPTT